MEALYHHIYDIHDIPVYPQFDGYSYGFLLVDNGQPTCCFTIDEDTDRHLQEVFENGAIEFINCSDNNIEMYYGFMDEEMRFFCEEKLFPKD